MSGARIIREGALTAQSVLAALMTERNDGRAPSLIAVSPALESVAMQILAPAGGTLDDLRATIPYVVVDRELPVDTWELRP